MSSPNRITAAASVRCVGGRFCHSKFFDALTAASNTRSEFMRENARGARAFQGCPNSLLDLLDFDVDTVTDLTAMASAGGGQQLVGTTADR